MRLRPLGLAAIVATVLLAACSLDTDEEPETIGGPTITPGASADVSTIDLPSAATENVSVWFLHNRSDDVGAYVVEAKRKVAIGATPAIWLDALLQQPPDVAERDAGIWSSIPLDARLVTEPEQRGHVLTVQLSERVYSELHGLLAQYAFAQIVYTATEIPGIESVLFMEDDGIFPAVDGAGQAHTDPLGRDDYGDLIP